MKILVIIVIYRQKLFDSKAYLDIKEQIESGQLFVYDNSPYPQHSVDELKKIGIHYYSDMSNGGVSKAYNAGVSYAQLCGFDWVLFLDQDTAIPDDKFLKLMEESIGSHPGIQLFVPLVDYSKGIMSPLQTRGYIPTKKSLPIGLNSLTNVAIINSGMMVNVQAFMEVGGYNPDVFLDFSDFQFINRFKKQYHQFYLLDYHLKQDFSNDEKNEQKIWMRFKIYCRCWKAFEHESFSSRMNLWIVVLKHSVALFIKTKKIKYLFYFGLQNLI